MSDFEKIAKVSEVPPGEVKSFVVGNEMVAVCNVDGKFYAFRDECTHQALPLSDGILEGNKITCIYHGAEFDVETGEALCLPATDDVETYPVKIEGEDLLILIED
ncbi:MAG: non-heme iron oxygenase ferredoxin subunit [Deltaproteobacteria bacterium]